MLQARRRSLIQDLRRQRSAHNMLVSMVEDPCTIKKLLPLDGLAE